MDPLSKLILESIGQDMIVDVTKLWNRIWKLGYPRHAIADQAIKLGLQLLDNNHELFTEQ